MNCVLCLLHVTFRMLHILLMCGSSDAPTIMNVRYSIKILKVINDSHEPLWNLCGFMQKGPWKAHKQHRSISCLYCTEINKDVKSTQNVSMKKRRVEGFFN